MQKNFKKMKILITTKTNLNIYKLIKLLSDKVIYMMNKLFPNQLFNYYLILINVVNGSQTASMPYKNNYRKRSRYLLFLGIIDSIS